HAETRTHVEPERFELADLLAQAIEIDDDTVADQAAAAGHHDAGGHEVEDDGLLPAHDAVPGVGSALIARDDVGLAAQRVDDLALAFIAPLGAYHYRARHRLISLNSGFEPRGPLAACLV